MEEIENVIPDVCHDTKCQDISAKDGIGLVGANSSGSCSLMRRIIFLVKGGKESKPSAVAACRSSRPGRFRNASSVHPVVLGCSSIHIRLLALLTARKLKFKALVQLSARRHSAVSALTPRLTWPGVLFTFAAILTIHLRMNNAASASLFAH